MPEAADQLWRFWRRLSYATVLVGFLALAVTGELNPIAMAMFSVFWVAGLFFHEQIDKLDDWYFRGAAWGVLALIGAVALLGQFQSVLYLLLFLAIYKCLRLRETVDHLHVVLITFFMLLACSIIMQSMIYLIFLFLLVILFCIDLVCYTVFRHQERFWHHTRLKDDRLHPVMMIGQRPSYRRMALSSILVALFIMLLAYGLFLMVPHYYSSRIPTPWGQNLELGPSKTGYKDEVSFGMIDQIELDFVRVMTVTLRRPLGDPVKLDQPLRMRGTSLAHYDSDGWRSLNSTQFQSEYWRRINLNIPTRMPGPILMQSIRQDLTKTQRLFSAFYPYQMRLPRGYPVEARLEFEGQAVRLVGWDGSSPRISHQNSHYEYQVLSREVEEATPLLRRLAATKAEPAPAGSGVGFVPWLDGGFGLAHLRELWPMGGTDGESLQPPGPAPNLKLDPTLRQSYTQLPDGPFKEKLEDLSGHLAPSPTSAGKVVQLYNWFQRDFEYTLRPETPKDQHPIEAFLFETRRGHCEYFATGLSLLMRAQGIPCRLVSGFISSEFDAVSQSYAIRQNHAHAWVEVWLDGYGWLTVDPTPPDYRGNLSLAEANVEQAGFLETWRNRFVSLWRNYMLNYGEIQQRELIGRIMSSAPMEWLAYRLAPLGQVMQRTPVALDGLFEGRWNARNIFLALQWPLAVMGLLVLLLLYHKSLRDRHRQSRHSSPIAFMNLLLDRLESLGWQRKPSQTPAEFIHHVQGQSTQPMELDYILELYHHGRFANRPLSQQEQRRAMEIINQIK